MNDGRQEEMQRTEVSAPSSSILYDPALYLPGVSMVIAIGLLVHRWRTDSRGIRVLQGLLVVAVIGAGALQTMAYWQQRRASDASQERDQGQIRALQNQIRDLQGQVALVRGEKTELVKELARTAQGKNRLAALQSADQFAEDMEASRPQLEQDAKAVQEQSKKLADTLNDLYWPLIDMVDAEFDARVERLRGHYPFEERWRAEPGTEENRRLAVAGDAMPWLTRRVQIGGAEFAVEINPASVHRGQIAAPGSIVVKYGQYANGPLWIELAESVVRVLNFDNAVFGFSGGDFAYGHELTDQLRPVIQRGLNSIFKVGLAESPVPPTPRPTRTPFQRGP